MNKALNFALFAFYWVSLLAFMLAYFDVLTK
jgi:hypothetical protein